MASTYLTRTLSSTGDVKKWTFSAWIKLAGTDTMHLMSSFNPSNAGINGYIRIDGGSSPIFKYSDSTSSGGVSYALNGERLFRDPSAWYHVMVSVDTAQTTATDRINFYVNGESMTYTTTNEPALNVSTSFNVSAFKNYIGCNSGADGAFFNGLMANVEFVDGQQYGPAYFGSTDSTTGIWTPQASSTISSYGTNGFKLKMDTATPGADTSGNTNTFTVGGGTPTLTQGSPSNVYATLNPLARFQVAPTYSNGNNTITAGAGGSGSSPFSTIGASSGKYYAELSLGSVNGGGISCGIIDITQFNPNFQTDAWFYYPTYGYAYMSSNGKKGNNNAEANYANSYTNGDRIGVAMDLDNNKLYFAKNGVWQNSGDPTSGATGTGAAFTIADGTYGFAVYGYDSKVWNANFGEGFFGTTAAGTQADDNGQGLFAYDVPAGYYALNTKNLEAYG